MKLKSLVVAAMVALGLQGTASAYDAMWFDRTADIDRFQKVVVFPIAKGERNTFYTQNIKPYGIYNYELHKRLTRHAKGITYYELFDRIPEKDDRIAKVVEPGAREHLLGSFSNEKLRADKVQESFAADGYIVPYLRARDIIIDHSPATKVSVEKYSYVRVEHAPNDKRDGEVSYTKDERRWTETVDVPAADLRRYVTDLEFTMYNEKGEKIFTCLNRRMGYNSSFDAQYKDMKDDFVDDLKDIKMNKEFLLQQEKDSVGVSLRIGDLDLLANVMKDEHKKLSCKYLFDKYARSMKDVRIKEGEMSKYARFVVDGKITRYDYAPHWVEPSAMSYSEPTKYWSGKSWKDKDGKVHTITYTLYEPTKVSTMHGFYNVASAAKVAAEFMLFDTKTNKLLLLEEYSDTNDKEVDALTGMMKKFFGKAEKIIGRIIREG